MMWLPKLHVLFCVILSSKGTASAPSPESDITTWLDAVNSNLTSLARDRAEDEWTFFTDISEANRNATEDSGTAYWNYVAHVVQEASERQKHYQGTDVISEQLAVLAASHVNSSSAATKEEQITLGKLQLLGELSKAMKSISNSAGSRSMDYDELLNDWRSLHDYMSRNARSDFEQFVKLLPDSETGVSDLSLSGMTSEVVGVYRRLHGYVRGELQKLVGPHRMPSTGHIPAHLVDVTDGSGWEHVLPDVLPFKHNFNFHTISRKVSNVSDMLEMVESFLDSLGVDNLTSVWQQRSVLTQPPGDTTILCEPPTVTNLYQSNDYRVVACLDVDEWGMRSAVELVYQLKAVQALDDKPFIMKDTSEDFVDAALGGALALAFSTPAHLKVTGLYDVSVNISEEDEINFLLDVALSQLPPLVMSNVTSGWQSRVLGSQRSSPTRIWNSAWWSLRCEQEGVSPPVTRTTVDFDAGASSSVLSNVPGQRLVKTVIAQFQILKSLCQKAGDRGRLAFCNIRDSKDVRNTIRAALGQIGSSQKLRELIGTDHLDAGPMLHYLKPLTLWLDEHLSTSENEWNPACPDPHTGKVRDSQAVQMFLDRYNMEGQKVWTTSAELSWALDTNITDYNQQAKVNYSLTESKFEKESAWEAAMFDGEHLDNAAQQRMIRMISDIGTDALRDEGKVKRLNEVLTSMTEIYNTATVCLTPKFNNCVPLDPDITRLMAKSRNYSELSDAWRLWRDATGRKLRGLYEEFVQLSNEGIQELGYEDTGDAWRSYYEDDTFQEELQALLNQLHPVYQQLHTYVRKRLMDFYGEDKFPSTGHIPAHILGNMWAQQWNNILDLVVPYPNKESVDVTDEMVKQNYTAHSMFEVAEEFYTSLGLSPMPERFWNKSMIERPADGRQVVCHASAWNFFNGKDFRIKMCTDITMEDLITIHHEMGHIQYYLQYKDQPIVFQSGANPGFHEAIGDVMGLSVATPKHLHKINLLKSAQQDNEADMNFLLKTALEKIAFLPFGYLIDQWRWSVFAGDTTPRDYNSRWWDLRCKYQGISPPVDRSEVDFDPGAKFHVPDNTPYIRYFVSFVMQFTFYKRLCEVANHTGPLHRCDFYQSREAGAVFKDMLQKGASKPWQDVLEDFNGQRSMNASAIIEFFQPLTEWLAEQNAGLPAGWTDACPPGSTKKILDESLARSWLQQYDEEAKQVAYETAVLEWNYATNITDNNQQAQVEGDLKFAQWEQKKAVEAARYDWRHLADDDLVRQFRSATDIGTSAMKNTTKLKQMGELQSSIEGIYAKAKVCANDTYCLELEPDLTRLLATSRDYNELLWAWEGWRNMTGPLMKDSYAKFVTLSNEAVQNLGYNDTGEYWRSWYESDTFQSDLEALLEQLSPLYQQLHAYVRRKLNEVYGADKFPYSGHIPAHLLGNMWAQEWNNLYDLVRPFANKSATDVTPELVKQGYTVEKMFSTSEDFYKSLGLEPMPISFWRDSMMEKPEDRDVVCHASAWDFSSGQDYRIKMCTDITMEDLITIHHEMGHIQYYLQYRHQPYLFQSGANPGFHEAIGDTLALSVSTPAHLHAIQLLPTLEEDRQATINYLMDMALQKIAFLPFGYLIDQWRWSVFAGDTSPEDYNKKWWDLRCKYQGISPPVARSSKDFDPGAKYHVPANTPYIRYFVSSVLQFQFYKALCQAAGYKGTLHNCDFYRSHEAGERLSNMLRLGSSKPWPVALEQMTGTRQMDAGPMMEYFQPLLDWLREQNAGQSIGWTDECPQPQLVEASRWLHHYDEQLEELRVASTSADWAYMTNITADTSNKSVQMSVKLAAFQRKEALEAEDLNWKNISDDSIHRQFQLLTNIGPSAMKDTDKFTRMEQLQSKMEGIYGAGEVCLRSSSRCFSLEPDLEDMLASERDYDKLLKVWEGWRNATGPKMRPLYEEFVALSNEGVRELGYSDTGEYWRSWYESDTFQSDLEALLEQLSPLYQQLHAYVRSRLIATYGQDKFPDSGHIPAHLLGNMWAQEWNNIYTIVQPYTNRTAVDVTRAMVEQNYTVERMFRTAESFFTSLGFEPLPATFWAGSMLQKPGDGRDVVCHASAWDFYNARDFRIKMCTYVTMEDLITIHHEMGHIQYFLQYRHQPQMFRDGANPGFHEAVGDTIALSVSTPGHLRKIGLLEAGEDNYLDEINFLLSMALEKVAFLPFGYLIDQWRWSVFAGDITPEDYNSKWWDLRCNYQGIASPVVRSEDDFDPGAKFHIPDNTPYIRYFVARVLQFQFQQALCKAAGHTGPLHQCDIQGSEDAGKLLRSMLSKGALLPWPEVLREMTGNSEMDAGALLQYFRPLQEWLEQENSRQRVGWTHNCPDHAGTSRTTSKTNHPESGLPDANTNSGEASQSTQLVVLILMLVCISLV